jgi:membrane protease YdiL (CAAX protease family)
MCVVIMGRMKRLLAYYTFLILVWVSAWLLYERINLETQSSFIKFVYWTIAKLIIWILPIVVIIKFWIKQSLVEYLALRDWKKGVKAGVVIGLIFIGLSFILDLFMRSFALPEITIGFFSAVFLSPVLEEIVFRGYVLGSLEKSGYGFWYSNFIAALTFLGIHLPGWYFMRSSNLTQPIIIFSIFLIGMIAGYAKKRSGSTWGSIFFHFVNNLYSFFIK